MMILDERIAALTTTSLSDIDSYRQVCAAAASDDAVFVVFRSLLAYQQILEHVSEELGAAYLEAIRTTHEKWLMANRITIGLNDAYGSPQRFEYPDIGRVSPTTLRYAYVAVELDKRFAIPPAAHVVEVGGGYGGQARLLDGLFGTRHTIIDLPEPCRLAERYLNMYAITDVEFIDALDPSPRARGGFLFLSNYALTECAPLIVRSYVERFALHCQHGYITGNAQRELLTELLASKHPKFEAERPVPSEFSDNFVCTW